MKFFNVKIFLVIILFLLTAIVLHIPSILAPTKSIPCSELPLSFGEDPGVSCNKRYWVAGPYYSAIINSLGHDGTKYSYFRRSNHELAYFSLFGQSLKSANVVLFYDDTEKRPVANTYGTGTNWSAASRIHLIFPINETSVYRIEQSGNSGPYEFVMTYPQKEAPAPAGYGQVPPVESQRLRIISFMCLVLVLLSGWHAYKQQSTACYCFMLVCSYLVLTLFCGMPFGSAVGWFDPGDDKSYVHWTFNLGYLLDPFLYNSNLNSWSQGNNHHLWGSGLLLAPFVMPAIVLGQEAKVGPLFLGLMSNGVIVLCLGSVLIFFASFKRIATNKAAAIAAFGTLACTSLLKWTYMRNLFSHAPEAFAISIATYGVIGRYFTAKKARSDFLLMLVGFFLAIQVRRENVGFLIPILMFEVLGTRSVTLKETWLGIKRNFWQIVAIVSTAVFAEIVLRLTSYFTDLRSFVGNVSGASLLRLDAIGTMIGKNGFSVLFGEDFGLFYWKNLFAIVPILALWIFRSKIRIWFPLVTIIVAYLSLCILYEMPNGMEWQNRFLLKLNPIFFGVLAVLMSHSNRIVCWVSALAVVLSAAFEIHLYRKILPEGMAFYVQQFGDVSLKFPPSYPGANMYIFYLPLISLLIILLLILGYMRWAKRYD
jgi:hypothetical protein